MSSLNKCIFIGNLVRDPDLRSVPGGLTVTDFTLAVNEAWKDKDGKLQESVTFLDFSVWGKQGENLKKFKFKGDPLAVVARAKQDRWEDKETKKKRSRIVFVADEITYIGSKRELSEEEKREAEKAGRRDDREGGDDDRPPYNDNDVPPDQRQAVAPSDVDKARQQFAGSTVGKPETVKK